MSKKKFCELIGLHPKSIYKGKKGKVISSAKREREEMDKEVLLGIKEVIRQRCTYGYKRVTALYNRKRVHNGLSRYNKKRIYRVMRDNGLLLPQSGIFNREHKGTGKVMTLHSNSKYDDYNYAKIKAANWYGKGSITEIQGYKIIDSLIYVSNSGGKSEACHIIPRKLKVGNTENYDHIGYWPSYSELNPGQKRMFLKWLSEGKNDTTIDIGYVFIYFYGLEYRVLKENKDLELIGYEIIRLRKYYASNRSFQGYSESLLAYIISNLKSKETAVKIFRTIEPDLDKYSVIYRSGIHLKINGSNSITIDELISLIPTFENVDRSSIPKKVGKYFDQYFKIIAKEEIEEAISQIEPKEYKEMYRSASSFIREEHYYKGFRIIVDRKIQDKLAKKWNQAIEVFRPYSRKLTKYDPKNIFSLLPEELRKTIDHPLKDKLKVIESDLIGRAVTVSEVATYLGVTVQEKLRHSECKEIVDALLHAGIIIEPNAVYFKENYKARDFVFLSKVEDAVMLDTNKYKFASLMADLGIDLAYSDNDYSNEEAQQIYMAIGSTFLSTAIEYEHLKLRVELSKIQKPKMSGVFKKISETLDSSSLEVLGSYLVGIALADGHFTKEEDKRIRTILSKLGIRETYLTDIYERLGISEVFKNVEIKTHQSDIQKGSLIPRKQEIILDQQKLSQIKSNTEKINSVLSKIFIDEEEKDYISMVQEEEEIEESLDAKHSLFLKDIIQQNKWNKKILRDKAKEFELMVNAAISKINKWTEEKYGDYLIFENDSNFEINHLILEDMNENQIS